MSLPNIKVGANSRPNDADGRRSATAQISIEEALELTQFGCFNYYLIVLAGIILATVILETLGISFVIPVSECDMQLSTRDKGLLSAIGFLGIISSSHLWGFLADTQGRRVVMLPTLLLSFAFTVASSLTTHFWLFVVLRFCNGFFVSGSSATIYAYLGEFHTQQHRSRAIMGASVVFGIACVLLPVLAWLVINASWQFDIPFIALTFKPWRLFLVTCGLPSLLCGFAMIPLPESPKFVLSQGKADECARILRRMYRWNVSKRKRAEQPMQMGRIAEEADSAERRERNAADRSDRGAAAHLLQSMWQQTATLFSRANWRRTCIACTIQFGIMVSANGMYMWFPDILNRTADFMSSHPGERRGLCEILTGSKAHFGAGDDGGGGGADDDVRMVSTMLANATTATMMPVCTTQLELSTYEHSIVLELMYAFGFAFIGMVISRIGKRVILFVILSLCGGCGIAAVFVPFPQLAVYLYVVLLLCGLAIPVVNAATVDLYPTNDRAMAVCISLMMGRLGSVVGTNLIGLLLDHYCRMAFSMSGSVLIFCACLAYFIPKNRPEASTKSPGDNATATTSAL